MEEEFNKTKSLQITQQLNRLGNELTTNVIELMKEVNTYTDYYYDNLFIPQSTENDFDGKKTKNEYQKGETIFDRVHETVLRNEILLQMQQTVETTMTSFMEKMNELRKRILDDKDRLTEINNETLENLMSLERKMTRKTAKSFDNLNKKNELHKSFNLSLRNNISAFKKISLNEERQIGN